MTLFTDEFLDGFRGQEPVHALRSICERVALADGRVWTNEQLADLVGSTRGQKETPKLTPTEREEAFALITEFVLAYELSDYSLPSSSDKIGDFAVDTMQEIDVRLRVAGAEEQRRMFRSKFASRFSDAPRGRFHYDFTAGDFDRVQTLVNELRAEVQQSPLFDEAHRQRLLARLEALQKELHKKMSDLDRFYGLVGDAGVVINKLGRDAAPIVTRIRELVEIVWRTQSRSEELPTDAKPALEVRNTSDNGEQE